MKKSKYIESLPIPEPQLPHLFTDLIIKEVFDKNTSLSFWGF